jgi:ATPases of the AAA+ class
MEEKKTRTTMKMDLLSAIEQIVEKAKDSKLSPEFYRKASRYIKYVSEKLELTKEQSVMMALFIDNSEDSSITISDFGKYVGCSTTRLIRYMNDIDVLEKREMVRCCRDRRGISYRVPLEVIESFKHNDKYVPADCSGLTCNQLFGMLEDIFDMRHDDELSFEMMCEKINHLLNSNKHLLFVQKLKSYNFDEDEELLLILFSHLFVNNSDDNIGYHDLEFAYGREERRFFKRIKGNLSEGDHPLLEAKMIEYNNDNGFVNRESFKMTQQAKRELFTELNLSSMNENNLKGGVLKVEDIVEKKLYYDGPIQSRITELGQLLDDNQYKAIRSRLKESGFRCGFTCLFYGEPGTGKTETVLQLAHQTGRDIIQVNISEIKSMWVGESEKNIKQLFDSYRKKVEEFKITPILLFNEADAIINKRNEGAERAVDKMENSIQNIILQEMENLDGILIATTNLAGNMDKAFERRFLYKIKFEKPTLEARMNIWHTMIPALDENVTRALASKYDFSGGQIENIARHYAINNILHGQANNILDTLTTFCDNERLETKATRKIGF